MFLSLLWFSLAIKWECWRKLRFSFKDAIFGDWCYFLSVCLLINLPVFLLKGQMTCLQNCGMWAQGNVFMASRPTLVLRWSLMSRSLWQAPLTTLWPAGSGVPEPGPSTSGGTRGRVGRLSSRLSAVTLTTLLKARGQECDPSFVLGFFFFLIQAVIPPAFSVSTVNPCVQVILTIPPRILLSVAHFSPRNACAPSGEERRLFFSSVSFSPCLHSRPPSFWPNSMPPNWVNANLVHFICGIRTGNPSYTDYTKLELGWC